MKRLDLLKYRALAIFNDGSFYFASNHTRACKGYEAEHGAFPDDEDTAGFLTVSELREVNLFYIHDEGKCRKVLESAKFIKHLSNL